MDKKLAFLEHWHKATDQDSRLSDELKKELNPEHYLFGKKFDLIARRFDMDDVLIELLRRNLNMQQSI